MESKRLTTSHSEKPQILRKYEEIITVPAGKSHFHLRQKNGTRKYTFLLEHEGSQLLVTGSMQPEAEALLEITLVHQAPYTRAETLVRTLGKGESKSTFRGLIKIEKQSFGCESYLNHHSLMFERAKSWSWPALEIGNNDVKCSHAATIKTITEADLFYPRSRGIGVDEAKNLMIEAFLSDVSY